MQGEMNLLGVGIFQFKALERSTLWDILLELEKNYKTFYDEHYAEQLVVIRPDGSYEPIQDRVTLDNYYYDGCKLTFIEKTKSKPKIRIRTKSEEKVKYFDDDFPNDITLIASYKNAEVSTEIRERLLLTAEAVDALLTAIEWDTETENNIVEQAGLLVGNRYKDSFGIVWGKVTHIIPLKHTTANRRAITMSSESFFEASTRDFPLLQANNSDLEIIGWYHTHTYNDQPVFSGTDYQTQSTTFASYKSWFALVLNAQQRTFSVYYNSQAVLVQAFIESSELIEHKYCFSINESYYGSEQKAKIKKGAYAEEQQRAELEKLRKDLEERERKINTQLSKLHIQEQKINREHESLENEKHRLITQRKESERISRDLSRLQSELSKKEHSLAEMEEMLKRVFPLAFINNNGMLRNLISPWFSTDSLRIRKPSNSCGILNDGTFDVFYESAKGVSGNNFGKEMLIYGKVLNTIRNLVNSLMHNQFDYCAIAKCELGVCFSVCGLIPLRELRNDIRCDIVIYAMDTYDLAKLTIIKNKVANLENDVTLYVYVEDTQTIYKKS